MVIPDIKLIRFQRFKDNRGYFTETYRQKDFETLEFMKGIDFLQFNESFSKAGTVRGLHFQWNPYMGKLVRTISGRMVDLVLDIRKGSETFGKIFAVSMPSSPDMDYNEWIWVPKGFAHGNYFTEESRISYLCSGQYNPECEAGISPLSKDIDWSLCDESLKKEFDSLVQNNPLLSEKDLHSQSLNEWSLKKDSDVFKME